MAPRAEGRTDREEELAAGVLAAFQQYLKAVRSDDDSEGEQLPDDPTVLSHLVAATASLTLEDRQSLLAEPDTASRLKAERALLRREAALLGQVRAVPVALSDLAVPSAQLTGRIRPAPEPAGPRTATRGQRDGQKAMNRTSTCGRQMSDRQAAAGGTLSPLRGLPFGVTTLASPHGKGPQPAESSRPQAYAQQGRRRPHVWTAGPPTGPGGATPAAEVSARSR